MFNFFKKDYLVSVKSGEHTGNLFVSAWSAQGACTEVKTAARIAGELMEILDVRCL